jgi:hypothetical protein
MSHLASLANPANFSALPLDILKTALKRWDCPGEDLGMDGSGRFLVGFLMVLIPQSVVHAFFTLFKTPHPARL